MPKARKTKTKNSSYKSFDEFDFDEVNGVREKRDVPVKSFNLEFKHGVQRLAWSIYQQHDILFMLGPAGTGKALSVDATLYSRTGPVKMGAVKIGDEIANPDGTFSKITGVYPQGKKTVYRVEFSDNTHVDCCEDHLWKVNSISDGWKGKVVDTKYILANYRTNSGRKKLYIETCKPVGFDRKSYDIPPYLMGILIAEGNFTNSNCVFSSADEEICDTISFQLKEGYCCKTKGIDHRIVKTNRSNKPNFYKESLKNLGLWGKYSYEKSIPSNYLYGSVDQRIALLQGLMDGDGTVSKKGDISYSTSSEQLAKDFCQLVYSLGGTTRLRVKENCGYKNKNGEFVECKNSFRCYVNLPQDIQMFLLSRKLRKVKARKKYFPKRYISNVIVLNDKVEMQCISVDHKDRLYLTDNFTVTHNTHLAMAFAIEEILNRQSDKKKIVLTRPVIEAGESLGYLPGTFDEKINPYMMPLWDCMQKIAGPTHEGNKMRNLINKSYEVAPLAYMRGRSQPLDAKVLTPYGYTTMGEIQIGTKVIGKNGLPTEVLGVYPQGTIDVYRIKFSDGTSVECSKDHLWSTMTLNQKRSGSYSVKTTEEIMSTVKDNNGRKIHRIPVADPVQFASREVDVDPYVLGVILGDGNCNSKASVTITNVDNDVLSKVANRLPNGLSLKVTAKNGIKYRVSGKRNSSNVIRGYLKKEGLLGRKSFDKWIPELYLNNSIETRLELLRGLMDTDGSIFFHRSGNCRVQFYSTSKDLAEGVRFLVHSLGGTASVRRREYEEDESKIKHCRASYVVEIVMKLCPFSCERKASKFKPMNPLRLITEVVHVGKKECQCIRVSADDSLYLTDHCIVTHNTFDDSVCVLDEAQNCTRSQLKLFLTRMGSNSKMIVTGDPKQSDVGGIPDLVDVVCRLESVPGVGVVYFNEECIVRHKMVGEILKRLEK